jgi:hypothetical protein
MIMVKPKRASVPKSVKDAIKGGLREPQLAEIASHFFTAAGGTRAIGQILWNEFNAAPEGSLARQRILDLILRALKFANERSHITDNLGLLSEDDLERELQSVSWEVAKVKDDVQEKEKAPGAGNPG